jgi:hypothetical protein
VTVSLPIAIPPFARHADGVAPSDVVQRV